MPTLGRLPQAPMHLKPINTHTNVVQTPTGAPNLDLDNKKAYDHLMKTQDHQQPPMATVNPDSQNAPTVNKTSQITQKLMQIYKEQQNVVMMTSNNALSPQIKSSARRGTIASIQQKSLVQKIYEQSNYSMLRNNQDKAEGGGSSMSSISQSAKVLINESKKESLMDNLIQARPGEMNSLSNRLLTKQKTIENKNSHHKLKQLHHQLSISSIEDENVVTTAYDEMPSGTMILSQENTHGYHTEMVGVAAEITLGGQSNGAGGRQKPPKPNKLTTRAPLQAQLNGNASRQSQYCYIKSSTQYHIQEMSPYISQGIEPQIHRKLTRRRGVNKSVHIASSGNLHPQSRHHQQFFAKNAAQVVMREQNGHAATGRKVLRRNQGGVEQQTQQQQKLNYGTQKRPMVASNGGMTTPSGRRSTSKQPKRRGSRKQSGHRHSSSIKGASRQMSFEKKANQTPNNAPTATSVDSVVAMASPVALPVLGQRWKGQQEQKQQQK